MTDPVLNILAQVTLSSINPCPKTAARPPSWLRLMTTKTTKTTKTSKTAKVEQDRPFRHSREWDPSSGRLPFDLSIAVFACSVVSSPLPIIWGLKSGPHVRLFSTYRPAMPSTRFFYIYPGMSPRLHPLFSLLFIAAATPVQSLLLYRHRLID